MINIKRYTIGIYFSSDLKKVALILKNRPAWQSGKFNFPGGKVEIYEDKPDEREQDCVVREFKEECGIITQYKDWKHIGSIRNYEHYDVDIFTSIETPEHGKLMTMEDEQVGWFYIDKLPENIISNVNWLTLFALNYWNQGHPDNLEFGIFKYKNKN